MFNFKQRPKTKLEGAIDDLLDQMKTLRGDEEEYATMVSQLNVLYKLKEIDIPKQLSPDTVMTVAGNLLGIAIIVGHEKANVVTSKAINFVQKLR